MIVSLVNLRIYTGHICHFGIAGILIAFAYVVPVAAQSTYNNDCQSIGNAAIIDSVEQSAFEEAKRSVSPNGPVSKLWYSGECLAVSRYSVPTVLYSHLLYYPQRAHQAIVLVDPEKPRGYKMGGWPDPDIKQFLDDYFSLDVPDSTCFAIASLIYTQLLSHERSNIVVDSLKYSMYSKDVECLQLPRIVWRELEYIMGGLRGPHAEVVFSVIRGGESKPVRYEHVLVSLRIFLDHIEWNSIAIE